MTDTFTPAPYTLPPEILREYDIRGQIDKNLGPQEAFAVGCAFGTMIRRKGGSRACIGYDGRDSSPALADVMAQGLASTGIEVENIGLGPSPMLYFAVKDHMADGGVMITGSHNPADYNGFKLNLQSGPVYGSMIQELGQIAAAGDFESGEGSIRSIDIKDNYVARLLRDFQGGKDLKIAWDCGNGAAGEIARRLTAQLPGTHILLFDEIDGSFPNHHPDPTVDKNLEDLISTVRQEGCDVGIAFDGDADRIGVVDENGTIIRCDTLMAVYAREVLEDHPGAAIIGDVKCSQVMYDEIIRLGGKAIMWKTGHSLIKAKMAETRAPLAGELSGHIFFGDKWYGFDDGLYCAVRLINILCDTDGPVSSLTAHLPTTCNTPEIRFEVEESEKFDLVQRVAVDLEAIANDDVKIIDIDGVRVNTPDGWWLLRASNTQNVLVTRAEATSPEGLERLKNMVSKEVAKIGYTVTLS
ncbi:MAG: phosphomannomutase/phosphoglucomutase [Rhodospirillales bacterium]|nr:phosphomannomutase/phosphoglucomutase [Rhodospirillales bacterium]